MTTGRTTKYIFVTGGVVSSLGKGLAAASPLPRDDTTPPVMKMYFGVRPSIVVRPTR